MCDVRVCVSQCVCEFYTGHRTKHTYTSSFSARAIKAGPPWSHSGPAPTCLVGVRFVLAVGSEDIGKVVVVEFTIADIIEGTPEDTRQIAGHHLKLLRKRLDPVVHVAPSVAPGESAHHRIQLVDGVAESCLVEGLEVT